MLFQLLEQVLKVRDMQAEEVYTKTHTMVLAVEAVEGNLVLPELFQKQEMEVMAFNLQLMAPQHSAQAEAAGDIVLQQ